MYEQGLAFHLPRALKSYMILTETIQTTWIQGLSCLQTDRKNLIWLQATAKSAPGYTNQWKKEKKNKIRKYKRKIRKNNIGWKRGKNHFTLQFPIDLLPLKNEKLKCKRFSKCRCSRITWSHIKLKISKFSRLIHDHMYFNIFPVLCVHVRKKD